MKRLFVFAVLSVMLVGMPLSGTPASAEPTAGFAWNTFLGGSGHDVGRETAVDSAGNVYVAGWSGASWGTPIRAYTSEKDVYVAKLNPQGGLLWHTFLGGAAGDFTDGGLCVGPDGNIYVSGRSGASWGAPVRPFTAGEDAFVAKLNGDGALLWNTFLGGSSGDRGYGITVDAKGKVYVTGESGGTWGTPIRPFTAADAFVAKLNSKGELAWNTFLGGAGTDEGEGITLGPNGFIFVAGTSDWSWGTPVRAYSSDRDGFAAKLGPHGVLKWNTFLGQKYFDVADGVVVNKKGQAFVVGSSDDAWGGPTKRAFSGGPDAYVAKLNADGLLRWNTFLGADSQELARSITRDSSEKLYVVGISHDAWGNPARAYSGDSDGFVAIVNTGGLLEWNTFLGGEKRDDAFGVAVDANMNVYAAGLSVATWGTPVRAYTGEDDAFVAKIR